MMKIKKFGALLVSAVLCIGMAAPAFAYEGDTTPVEEPVLPEIVEEEDAVTITDEETGALTPEGNLTLVDDYHTNYSDGSGQQFITMVSKSGATFYLVIDRNAKGQQTVHFMNLVDEADLLALMEEDAADAYTAEKEAAAQAEQDRLKAVEDAKKAAEAAAASGTETPKENKVTKIASGFLGVVVLIALAAGGIFSSGHWIWCLVIGALIVVWIMVGITNLGKINTVAMTALFLLTLVLCKVIFFGGNTVLSQPDDSLSFGAAVELAVAMPLSWLPLISDYTREAEKPVTATAVSAIVYGLVSCWMYVIGMGASILTGESDIAQIMLKAGLSVIALIIVVFSTVTTTFLDAYSAGISNESIFPQFKGQYVAVAVTVVGTIGAIVFPMDDITGFLYLIGSVFAPMIAIQIADYFILHRDRRRTAFDARNLVIWVIGFVLYRILMNVDLPVGNTLPDMIITIVLCVIAGAVLH